VIEEKFDSPAVKATARIKIDPGLLRTTDPLSQEASGAVLFYFQGGLRLVRDQPDDLMT
jgi:hypothetical protein